MERRHDSSKHKRKGLLVLVMIARVKATGEIIEVRALYEPEDYKDVNDGTRYDIEELELFDEPDYWDRLYNQAAIYAMQAILSNMPLLQVVIEKKHTVAESADAYAEELIAILKKKQDEKTMH